MTRTRKSPPRLWCAAAAALSAAGSPTAGQTRNCPTITDQVVVIVPGQPAFFRLDVENLGDSTISIFQFPLGGNLRHVGPTQADFLFIPAPGFSGSTQFTYRLTPPFGCGEGALLRRVTLVGGTAGETASGLVTDTPEELEPDLSFLFPDEPDADDPAILPPSDLCGLGTVPPLFAALTALGCGQCFARRPRPRR